MAIIKITKCLLFKGYFKKYCLMIKVIGQTLNVNVSILAKKEQQIQLILVSDIIWLLVRTT